MHADAGRPPPTVPESKGGRWCRRSRLPAAKFPKCRADWGDRGLRPADKCALERYGEPGPPPPKPFSAGPPWPSSPCPRGWTPPSLTSSTTGRFRRSTTVGFRAVPRWPFLTDARIRAGVVEGLVTVVRASDEVRRRAIAPVDGQDLTVALRLAKPGPNDDHAVPRCCVHVEFPFPEGRPSGGLSGLRVHREEWNGRRPPAPQDLSPGRDVRPPRSAVRALESYRADQPSDAVGDNHREATTQDQAQHGRPDPSRPQPSASRPGDG